MLKKQIVFISALCAMQLSHGMQGPDNGLRDLRHAALYGKLDEIRRLIASGVDLNARSDEGQTVLMAAAIQNNKAVCKVLIEMGADLNAQDEDGSNALFYVLLAGGASEIFQLIIDAGADVNQPDNIGRTPLIFAASASRLLSMRQLLGAGADCDAVDNYGETALMRAARSGSLAACELLLQYGADPEMRDRAGMRAFDHATQSERMLIDPVDLDAAYLLNNPKKIHAVIMREDNPNLRKLWRFGPNIATGLMMRELGRK